MPDLHLITNLFVRQRYEVIKEWLNLNTENKMVFWKRSKNNSKIYLGAYKEEDGFYHPIILMKYRNV